MAMKTVFLFLALAISAFAAASQHTVTVTFDYDFTVDNACSTVTLTGCVKQFNVYDVTSGAIKLFSVTTPAGANSAMTGITATSGLLTIKSGSHSFVATAQMADGTESVNSNTAAAVVKPNPPSAFGATIQ